MTLQPTTHPSILAAHPFGTALLVAGAILIGMIALTAIFGIHVTGPSYEIVPDPAGLLPF